VCHQQQQRQRHLFGAADGCLVSLCAYESLLRISDIGGMKKHQMDSSEMVCGKVCRCGERAGSRSTRESERGAPASIVLLALSRARWVSLGAPPAPPPPVQLHIHHPTELTHSLTRPRYLTLTISHSLGHKSRKNLRPLSLSLSKIFRCSSLTLDNECSLHLKRAQSQRWIQPQHRRKHH